MDWLNLLKKFVEETAIVVFSFEGDRWKRLAESRRGINEFTVALPHDSVGAIKPPTPCLIFCNGDDGDQLYFGLVTSRAPITTLESRIKVRRAVEIQPQSKAALLELVSEQPHSTNLKKRLEQDLPVAMLSAKLGSYLIERLASIDSNQGAMRAVAESLSAPKHFSGSVALQADACQ